VPAQLIEAELFKLLEEDTIFGGHTTGLHSLEGDIFKVIESRCCFLALELRWVGEPGAFATESWTRDCEMVSETLVPDFAARVDDLTGESLGRGALLKDL
jgi:hypothetical protein